MARVRPVVMQKQNRIKSLHSIRDAMKKTCDLELSFKWVQIDGRTDRITRGHNALAQSDVRKKSQLISDENARICIFYLGQAVLFLCK